MRPGPGSVPWLLHHELRLGWRAIRGRTGLVWLIVLAVFSLTLIHLAAVPLAWMHSETPLIGPDETFVVLSGALLFGLFGMVSTGLVAGVQLIYGRGDMELILSSPMRPRTVIAVRAVVIAASLLSLSALITWPFANIFALFGHPRFLVAYVAVPCLALIAASLSLALAHAVFRVLGPRRTRLMAQVLAGLIALAFALLPQVPGLLVEEPQSGALAVLAARLPGPESWLWLPARALQGEPGPLIGAIVVSFAVFWLTIRTLADGLIADAVKAAGTGSAAGPSRSGSRGFPGSTLTILRRKELYLLTRDPWLLAKITSQMLFLVPIALLVWNAQGTEASPAWLLLVVLAGNLGGSFAWVTVSGEDAPDLLAAAPIRRRDVLRAKIEAALLAVAVIVAVPLLVAAAQSLWLGLTLLVCCAGSALSGALISVLFPSPARRADFHQRGKGNAVVVTCEMLMAGTWALPGYLMLHRSLWALPVALVLLWLPALFKGRGSRLPRGRRNESRPA
jgi:ABC-2 type transport system permease protein